MNSFPIIEFIFAAHNISKILFSNEQSLPVPYSGGQETCASLENQNTFPFNPVFKKIFEYCNSLSLLLRSMENLFTYIQKLELLAFFSGYSLLYLVVLVFAGKEPLRNKLKNRLIAALPLSYAMTGTLYLGLQAKNFYYAHLSYAQYFHHPFLQLWGSLSILFWIPAIRKKEFLSLFHSLVFFFILFKDVFQQISRNVDEHVLKNDMKIYSVSIFLNLGCFIFIVMLSVIKIPNKKRTDFS